MPEDRLVILPPNDAGLHLIQDVKAREYWEIYQPYTPLQLREGHVQHKWYYRPTTWRLQSPASKPADTFEASITALRDRQQLRDLCNGE